MSINIKLSHHSDKFVSESHEFVIDEVVNAWLLATNENGQTGWIPAETVVSEVI